MRLLKQHDLKGLGGVLLEDVQESLPHCEKVLKNRAAEILFIIRPIDKKKILFYNDRTANFSVISPFFGYCMSNYIFLCFRWMKISRSCGVRPPSTPWMMLKSMSTLRSRESVLCRIMGSRNPCQSARRRPTRSGNSRNPETTNIWLMFWKRMRITR